MDFDGLDANFDALNAYDDERLENALDDIGDGYFATWDVFFLLHLAARASLATLSRYPLLRYRRVASQNVLIRKTWGNFFGSQPLES